VITPLSWLIALAVAAAPLPLAHVQPSAATDSPDVEAMVTEASAAFDAGDFDGAIAAFERAYAAKPDPRFLYNIGRIHEEAGQLDLAVDYYRRFVAQPGVELEQRELASQRIEVLTRIRSSLAPTSSPLPPPRVSEPAQAPRDDAPPRTDAPGRAMRNTGIGLLAGGAAMLVTSAITGTFARSTETELGDENNPVRRRDLVDRGRSLALTTDIVMSLGAALAVVGTVLTATGATRMRRARRDVAVRPSGAGLRLRF
jgi:hypothetical protein